MPTPANDLNITQPGIVVFDGTATFTGKTLQAGTGISITNGSGIAGNPTISASGASGIQTLTGNSGGAISPSGGNISTLGTGSVTVAGSGSTLTAQLTGLTNHALQVGAGTATLTQLGAGTTGQILQTNTGADPTWSTATYPSSSGGTGKILYDNGTNFVESTPTFPASASATARKITVSDGTNWVASTETWAVPGTSGNVLTSDGTNWTSAAAPGAGLITLTGTLTSAQIKALHGTPITAIAAGGSGKVIQIISIAGKMNYGGNNAFVAGSSQTVSFYWGTATTLAVLIGNTGLVATSTQFSLPNPSSQAGLANTSYDNTAIMLYNPIATEITGNAAGDNTITWSIIYRIVAI